MLLTVINKKDILKEVKRSISQVKKEIIATMLLSEEIKKPLPISYFNLINKKVKEGIVFKRLGFGKKEDYNMIKQKLVIKESNYIFKYNFKESRYQRLIIIDRKTLFFGAERLFFKSIHKPLIDVFLRYFYINFKKGKI
jgi:hypothetical protein